MDVRLHVGFDVCISVSCLVWRVDFRRHFEFDVLLFYVCDVLALVHIVLFLFVDFM